jgi:hypothetical protein
MKLWVDDVRPAPKGWVWARGYKAARRLLEEHDWGFDIISLDHDLGGHKSGYDLLCEIEQRAYEYQNYKPFIGIHTMNMAAREKMARVAEKLNARRLKR